MAPGMVAIEGRGVSQRRHVERGWVTPGPSLRPLLFGGDRVAAHRARVHRAHCWTQGWPPAISSAWRVSQRTILNVQCDLVVMDCQSARPDSQTHYLPGPNHQKYNSSALGPSMCAETFEIYSTKLFSVFQASLANFLLPVLSSGHFCQR